MKRTAKIIKQIIIEFYVKIFKILMARDPCKKCLVRPCCNEPCEKFEEYFMLTSSSVFLPNSFSLEGMKKFTDPILYKVLAIISFLSIPALIYLLIRLIQEIIK